MNYPIKYGNSLIPAGNVTVTAGFGGTSLQFEYTFNGLSQFNGGLTQQLKSYFTLSFVDLTQKIVTNGSCVDMQANQGTVMATVPASGLPGYQWQVDLFSNPALIPFTCGADTGGMMTTLYVINHLDILVRGWVGRRGNY